MSRIGRWFALICLLSSLLLPRFTPPSAATPALGPAAAPLAIPPLPNLPKPTQAGSTGYTAEQAEALVEAYEAEHTLDQGYFDGTFSQQRREIYQRPDTITLGPTIDAQTSIIVPANSYGSLEIDVTVSRSTNWDGGASMAVRPVTSTADFNWVGVLGTNGQASRSVQGYRATINNKVPPNVAMEVAFRCTGYWVTGAQATCSWSNLRLFDDVPGWTPLDVGPAPHAAVIIGVEGLQAQDGPFLRTQVITEGWGVSYSNPFLYQSPLVHWPTFAPTDTITASFEWSRSAATSWWDGPPSGFSLSFVSSVTNNYLEGLATTPLTSTQAAIPWQTAMGTPSATRLSGQIGWIRFLKEQGGARHTMDIDSIRFYRNGELLDLPLADPDYVIPDDQAAGRCICQEAGAEVGQAQGYVGDPVNTRSGALYVEATDLVVPTSGPPLRMDRAYVSMFADASQYHTTWMGPGWRYTLGPILILPGQVGGEPDTIIFDHPSGNRLRFLDQGDGTFEALRGIRASLTTIAAGYELSSRDGEIWRFDQTGRIVERQDAQGRLQRSIYGTNPAKPTFGQRIQVQDVTTGRSLWFTYLTLGNGEERIASVRNDAGATISYTYTAQGELETVTDLRGNVTRYAYAAETPGGVRRLTTIWKPGDKPAAPALVTSYADGRVERQVEHTDLTTVFDYAVGANGTQVTTIQHAAPGQPPETITHHYRRDGSLRLVARNGRFVQYLAYGRDMAPTVIIDGGGQVTRIASNGRGQPARLTNALGLPVTIAYSATTLPATVTAVDGTTTRFSYDQWRNPTETVQRGADGLTMRSTAVYDAQRRVIRETGPDGVTIGYGYDSLGQPITTTFGLGTAQADTTRYVYDALGRVTETIYHDGTPLAVTTRIAYRPDWQIDSVIQNVRGTGVFHKDYPDQNLKTTYGYDTLGRPIWTRDVLGRYHNYVRYDAAGRIAWRVENPVDSTGMVALPGATAPVYAPAFPDANVVTHYGYDALGRTTLVTETGILTGTFNLATRQFSSAATRTTRTEYDQLGRPVTVTLNYRPDISAAAADVNLALYTYYDGAGNVIWQSDPLGRWTRTEYDPIGRPVTTTVNFENGDPLTVDSANLGWTDGSDTDRISVTRYDANGRAERTIENHVDGAFTITEPVTDRVTLFQHDSLGRVITTTHTYSPTLVAGTAPEVNRTRITRYDPLTHRIQARQNTLGQWTVQSYDARGRVIQTVTNCADENDLPAVADCAALNPAHPDRNLPSGSTYNLADQLLETTDALGRRTAHAYDPLGRLIATTQNYRPGLPITADTNVQAGTSYNPLGQVVATSDALGRTTVMRYDNLGAITAVVDPAGVTTEQGSDATGQPRWAATADGKITVTLVDGMGRPVRTIQNYQNGVVETGEAVDRDLIERTAYDQAGRTIATIDVQGRETDIVYDLHDQITAVIENVIPHGQCVARTTNDCNLRTQFHYDRVGNRLAVTDANGYRQRITTYNAADWPVREQDLLGHERRWTYAADGQVATLFTGETTLAYTYDALGRVTEARTNPTAVVQTSVYNVVGQLTSHQQSAITPGGSVVTAYDAAYDALGRLIDSSQTISPNTYQATVGYTYNAAGERIGLTYPNGTTVAYSYTPRGELDLVTEGVTTLADYTYDSTGWLAQAQFASGVRMTQTRDEVGRLRGREYRTGKGGLIVGLGYTLNRRGERLTRSEQRSGTTTTETYAYDDMSRLASAAQGTTARSYRYDKAGNRLYSTVNGQTTSRAYTAANQVVGWSYDGAGNLLQDSTSQYTYDGFGRLTSVRRLSDNATTANAYMADGTLMRQETTSAAGSERREYETDWASPLTQVLRQTTISGLGATSSERYVYGDERLFAVDGLFGGTARTWQLHDGLGSVIATTTNAGTLAGTQSYDPWGTRLGTAPAISRFGFAGELTDGQSGLVYLRARWYHPTEGTLLGRDPYAGDALTPYSMHPYQYAYSNPGLLTDPSGRCIPADVPVLGQEGCEWAGLNPVNWNWEDGADYARGVGDAVYEYADGVRSVVNPTPMESYQKGQEYVHMLTHPEEIPGMIMDGITSPFEEFYQGWLCQDFRMMGHGAVGSGAVIVDLAGGLQSVVNMGRALAKPRVPRAPRVRPGTVDPEPTPRRTSPAEAPCPGNSFVAGTLVKTEHGLVAIETLREGDRVWAVDPETGAADYYPITWTTHHATDEVVTISVMLSRAAAAETAKDPQVEVITATDAHPFWVEGRGWTDAGDLHAGDTLLAADGRRLVVSDVERATRTIEVYNFTVDTLHTYTVTRWGVVVHNVKRCVPSTAKLWEVTRENSDRMGTHIRGKFSNFLRTRNPNSQGQKHWWSRDTAGHGKSAWKVFEERQDGLHWIEDADQYGNYMPDKHKGPTGLFIPWKDLVLRDL